MIASKRHTVNIKNINIRHTQFGGASLDINISSAKGIASEEDKDPTQHKKKNRKTKNPTKNKN